MPHEVDNEPGQFLYMKKLPIFKTEEPFQIFHKIPANAADKRSTNVEWAMGDEEPIYNMRGHEKEFSLNQQGFTVVNSPTGVVDFDHKEDIVSKYLPECHALIMEHVPNVKRIVFFDHRGRKGPKAKNREYASDLPSVHPHIDQAPQSVIAQVHRQFGDQAEALLQGRVRIINIWRPTAAQPVQDNPLALCDVRTVSPDRYMDIKNVYLKDEHYIRYITYKPGTKWHYLSGQSRDEATMLKIYDSHPESEVRGVVHSSFVLKNAPADALPRESIEVRAFVFSDV